MNSISDVEYQELTEAVEPHTAGMVPNLDILKHVEVTLEVRIGEATLSVAELFSLKAGSVLTLNRDIDEPVEVLLNGKIVAAGHLAVSGERLGVRITEILNTETRLVP